MSAYANDGFVTLKVRVFLEAMLILLESEKLATVDPSNERLETGYGLLSPLTASFSMNPSQPIAI